MEEEITFRSCDFDIRGILNSSKKEKGLVVILCHGFMTHKNNRTNRTLKGFLEKKGVDSFRFDFFAHGESGGDFSEITVSKAIDNLKSACNIMKERGYERIALLGSSFGGFICLKVSENIGPEFLILKCPVSDYMNTLENIDGKEGLKIWKEKGFKIYRSDDGREKELSYSFVEDIKRYDRITPDLGCPVFIVHGDNDTLVNVEDSIRLHKSLKNSNLHMIHGADHFFSQPKDWEEMISSIEEFIEEQINQEKSQNY